MPETFLNLLHVADHVVAVQHAGLTVPENLSLCCSRCNRHKGPNVGGIDREGGQFVRLYNPRIDRWHDHFAWSGAEIVGRTPSGRVTALILNLNSDVQLKLRTAAIADHALDPLD
jgi:hypothetical protein